ncbi:hypothetical protein [Maribacter sp. 2307ULW6-5]|uniref:hypothetical protein n=1 Tax=Maribacter sp. 2307ULW6-5 TaxID=3386275 RepID=UPI0039BC2C54
MKNKMEVRSAIKKMIFTLFMGLVNMTFCQEVKYLSFDKNEDSIVMDIDKSSYYKIGENLFWINRFNEIDTISKCKISKITFTSVRQLWEEGKKMSDSILSERIKKQRIQIIESKNEIFEKIYVIEKIGNKNYKRTRVWWVDY